MCFNVFTFAVVNAEACNPAYVVYPISTIVAITDPFVRIGGTQSTTPSTPGQTYTATKNAIISARNSTIYVGSTFDIMKNVRAVDDGGRGNNITSLITVTGSINTAVAGRYTVTYKVVGQNGVVVTKKITVTVALPSAQRCA